MGETNPDPAERKRESKRRWAAANRDKILEKNRKYREANREQLREKGREYREANRDELNERRRQQYDPQQAAAYYQANRDERRKRNRQYYEANRDDVLARVKSYADANRPQIREYWRRYYAGSGGDKVRLDALMRAHGRDFVATWAAMWDAQQGLCYLCERPMDPAEAFMEHWHGCPGHEPKKSCRYCQRGLAHQNCNLVVGHAADDPSLLRIIADNLERANADVAARQAVMPQSITLF